MYLKLTISCQLELLIHCQLVYPLEYHLQTVIGADIIIPGPTGCSALPDRCPQLGGEWYHHPTPNPLYSVRRCRLRLSSSSNSLCVKNVSLSFDDAPLLSCCSLPVTAGLLCAGFLFLVYNTLYSLLTFALSVLIVLFLLLSLCSSSL